MGADLYMEPEHSKHRDKVRPLWDAAIRKRDLLFDFHYPGGAPRGEDGYFDPEKMNAECKAAHEEADRLSNEMWNEDTYYRDSYNVTNLMWRLDYEVAGHGAYGEDEDGYLTPAGARRLINAIKDVKPRTVAHEHGNGITDFSDKLTPEDIEKWDEYFREKKQRLIRFLERAIETNQTIHCSC